MKIITYTSEELEKIPKLQLSRCIISSEARLFLDEYLNLIKIYYRDEPGYLADKVNIITKLIAYYEDLDLDELVLPTALVGVDSKIAGFTMPFIENNINLSLILGNKNISLEEKIKYLKELYRLLEKLMNIKNLKGNFFLGDVHESNFIFDIDKQIIRTVDLDSAYFKGGSISTAKYLTTNYNLSRLKNKYPSNHQNKPVPSRETTIACYIYILLNTLSGSMISNRWTVNEFNMYLDFLKNKGVSNDLIESIRNIYCDDKPNYFDENTLDSINPEKSYVMTKGFQF